MLKSITATAMVAFLAGCANSPDVTFNYYPAKWNSVATVTQTVGCYEDKKHLAVLNAPSVATTYSSDFAKAPFTIKLKDLDGFFADSEMTMTFTDDGRLKTVNQSSTGQGEAIVKSAVALFTALTATKLFTTEADGEAECKLIQAWGGGKPVTLIYRATIDATQLGKTVTIHPGPESKDLHARLKKKLPILEAVVGTPSGSKSGPGFDASKAPGDVVLLELQRTGLVAVDIRSRGDSIWDTHIVIPQSATYKLPIPKAALFGKQTFTLAVSEAGAVTSVGYGKTSATAGVLNALGAIAAPETTAAKAAELKAEADLIAQQQRLVICQTKPSDCK